ncbi:MAG TPA: hypothetical protein VH575_12265 [Gemmataceae bacterium]
MSEPLAERLSRFTPDGMGLDRDALLFAAGRASARPSRRWQALAAALAASQLLTLVCLWPHTPPSAPPAVVAEQPPVAPEPPAAPDPSALSVLRERLLADDGDKWPSSVSDGPMVPDDPPLHAFGAPPSTILN